MMRTDSSLAARLSKHMNFRACRIGRAVPLHPQWNIEYLSTFSLKNHFNGISPIIPCLSSITIQGLPELGSQSIGRGVFTTTKHFNGQRNRPNQQLKTGLARLISLQSGSTRAISIWQSVIFAERGNGNWQRRITRRATALVRL